MADHNVITDGNRRLTDPWVPCDKPKEQLPNCGDSAPAVYEHSRGVRIRRVRIRADCYTRLTEAGAGQGRRGLAGANFTYEQVCSSFLCSSPLIR